MKNLYLPFLVLFLLYSCTSHPQSFYDLELAQEDYQAVEAELTSVMEREAFLTYRLLRDRRRNISLVEQEKFLDEKIGEMEVAKTDEFYLNMNKKIRSYINTEKLDVSEDVTKFQTELVTVTKNGLELRKQFQANKKKLEQAQVQYEADKNTEAAE